MSIRLGWLGALALSLCTACGDSGQKPASSAASGASAGGAGQAAGSAGSGGRAGQGGNDGSAGEAVDSGAGEGPTQTPTTCGLSGKYLGDAGIGSDPAVIFADDFEAASIAEILARWSSSGYDAGMSLVADVPQGSSGQTSIQITTQSPDNQGADLFKHFANSDLVYFRYYVKYASDVLFHHAGGWIGGFNPGRDYPLGTAGLLPNGADFFSVGAEPADAELHFDMYTYWMHMRPLYGNLFVSDDALKVTVDRWTCVEVMLKMNDPVTSYNGELQLWLDGVEIIHLSQGSPTGTWNGGVFTRDATGMPFEGFQWRSDAALSTNNVFLDVYITDSPAGKMWFDDLVVAKQYIGPLNTSGQVCP